MLANLFIIAAPSGAGKTSLVSALTQRMSQIKVSISHTTRPKRPGEADGENYFFVSDTEFTDMINEDIFLEHAKVFQHHYGTSQRWVEQQLAKDTDVILEIDWQGARQVRSILPDSVGIFILPPSRETLEARLIGRGQDSEDTIADRMHQASAEISHYSEYDYLIINDDFEQALAELMAIIQAKRLLQARQANRHSQLINALLAD